MAGPRKLRGLCTSVGDFLSRALVANTVHVRRRSSSERRCWRVAWGAAEERFELCVRRYETPRSTES